MLHGFAMLSGADLSDVERAIQLAIAPAFLMTAAMTAMNVLVGRLARSTDRARAIEGGAAASELELAMLSRRCQIIRQAIMCCALSGMLVCLLIICAFLGVVLSLPITVVLAILLTAAMTLLIVALIQFLTEVWMAARHLPLPPLD